jgi:ketosteroid isomerase-like protein
MAATTTCAEADIRAAIARFIAAYNAGDVGAVLACYCEDLVKLRHQGAPESKPEAAARIREVLAAHRGQLSVTVDEIMVSGDLAFTRGTLDVRLTPRCGGAEVVLERRYVELWRHEEGLWRVARTMDNVG